MLPVYEKLQVSKKMTPSDSKPVKYFEIDNYKNTTNEKDFVESYKNEIVELILNERALISSTTKTIDLTPVESSTLKSLPTLVNIDFKEDFGIIGIYE